MYSKHTLHNIEVMKKHLSIQMTDPGKMLFVAAAPGSGKTSGIVEFVTDLLLAGSKEVVFIGLPTVVLIEEVKNRLLETAKLKGIENPREFIGYWSREHCETQAILDTDRTIEKPAEMVNRETEFGKQIVVVSTTTIKNFGDIYKELIKEPSLVIMDEDPNPAGAVSVARSEFAEMRDSLDLIGLTNTPIGRVIEAFDVYLSEATERPCFTALGQEVLADQFIHAYEGSSRLQSIDGLATFYQAMKAFKLGNAFTQDRLSGRHLTYYEWDLPFTDRMVIVSATVRYESLYLAGWGERIVADEFVPIDYSDVEVEFIGLPRELIGGNRQYLKGRVPPEVLLEYRDLIIALENRAKCDNPYICTFKDMRGTFENADAFIKKEEDKFYSKRKDRWNHFGTGVGLNKWSFCDSGIILGLFYKPPYTEIAVSLSARQLQATPCTLEPYQNVLKRRMRDLNEATATRNFWQSVTRTHIREVRDGKAMPTKIFLLDVPSKWNFVKRMVKELMPDAKVTRVSYNRDEQVFETVTKERPKRRKMSIKAKDKTPLVCRRALAKLADTTKDTQEVTVGRGKDAEMFANTRNLSTFVEHDSYFRMHGWLFSKGSGRKSGQSRFVRV